MKFLKRLFALAFCVSILCLSACSAKIDYTSYVSELRKELFTAENEQVSVMVYTGAKESPAILDGIKNDTRLIIGIKAIFNQEPQSPVTATVCFDDKAYEIPLNFHPVKRALAGEIEVPVLPEKQVDIKLLYDQTEILLTAKSRLFEDTVSYNEALASVTQKAESFLKEHVKGGVLKCEIIIRLLCEHDKNYYYVGLVCDEGLKRSYLVDGKTGEVVAEKIN